MRHIALAALALVALIGCSHASEPKAGPGTGTISGKLVGTDQAPFDLSLAGPGAGRDLRIDLVDQSSGVVASTYPKVQHSELTWRSEFVFSDVKPGSYELTAYANVPGKRSVAGSQPVTVNPGEVTPITLVLQVTPAEGAAH